MSYRQGEFMLIAWYVCASLWVGGLICCLALKFIRSRLERKYFHRGVLSYPLGGNLSMFAVADAYQWHYRDWITWEHRLAAMLQIGAIVLIVAIMAILKFRHF